MELKRIWRGPRWVANPTRDAPEGFMVGRMRHELERLAVEGDFDGFYRAQYVGLVRALLLLTGDPGEAEDLAQEALSRVYERRGRVWAMDSSEGYLFRTALNLHRKRARRSASACGQRHRCRRQPRTKRRSTTASPCLRRWPNCRGGSARRSCSWSGSGSTRPRRTIADLMRRLGLLAFVLVLLSGLAACESKVHRAKILDVRLGVEVTDFRIQHPKAQSQQKHHPLTLLDVGLSISNPADQRVWANNCHGQAFDDGGNVLYTFSFSPGPPAGAYVEEHETWKGSALATARVSHDVAATAVSATATCQAWDWGDSAPI